MTQLVVLYWLVTTTTMMIICPFLILLSQSPLFLGTLEIGGMVDLR